MTTTKDNRNLLHWELFTKKRASATQGIPAGKEALAWVAGAVTLLYGERDAVLVDTLLGQEENIELADWIASKGRTLRTIYITHGHPDHFFGLKLLMKRFPEARAYAPPQVVAMMNRFVAPEMVANLHKRWPGQLPSELSTAEVLEDNTFDLEGYEIHVIDTGHTDTDATTALHVPSLNLVIAGDAVYNETHSFLLESDHAGRLAWLQAIDKIAALNPRAVIAGHGPLAPDNSPRHVEATRQYIRDFERLVGENSTAQELYDSMLALYPDRINPGSLWGSAHAAKPAN
jgi:glyoxylase-like metal-dependent hydrolase (beta-lactamase superfamily II)